MGHAQVAAGAAVRARLLTHCAKDLLVHGTDLRVGVGQGRAVRGGAGQVGQGVATPCSTLQ
jgi:hypothetical protein